MNNKYIFVFALLAAIAAFISFIGAADCPDAQTPCLVGDRMPFGVGEHTVHSIRVPLLLNSTLATMDSTIDMMTNIRGHRCYRVYSFVRTTDVVWNVFNYKLYNIYIEYFDATTFEDIRIVNIYDENGRSNKTLIEIYPETQTMRYSDMYSNFTKTYTHRITGMLSMIYGARVLRQYDGDEIDCAFINGYNIEDVVAYTKLHDEYYAPALDERLNVIKIERLDNGTSIWLSDDDRRIPVFMVSTPILIFGFGKVSLVMQLEQYDRM